MFGFAKHYPICGMDVKKESSIKKFGKYFCSEPCVEKYLQHKSSEKYQPRKRRCS